MQLTREDRSIFGRWWFTVDHQLMTALLLLILTGVVVSLATGPAMAERRGYEAFHYVERQMVFAVLAALIVLTLSFLTSVGVRRFSLLVYAGAYVLVISALIFGVETNGARRWVSFAGQSFQPSEILKPVFIVLSAWLLAMRVERPDLPLAPVAVGLLVITAAPLVLQPDIGQTILLVAVWGGLLFIAGVHVKWIASLVAGGLAALGLAYLALHHVRRRIDAFISPDANDTYQMDLAHRSFVEGGFFGRGPGEGTVKTTLPDAHTDFVLAVVAEEYGIIACIVIIGFFVFIAARVLGHIWREQNSFLRIASAGLVMLLTCQALINMGVNVGLLPTKGMTLPFVSYGGSSLVGTAITVGLVLALTRRRPGTGALRHSIGLPTGESAHPVR